MISIRRIGQGFFNNMYNQNGSFSIYISQQCMVGEPWIQPVKKRLRLNVDIYLDGSRTTPWLCWRLELGSLLPVVVDVIAWHHGPDMLLHVRSESKHRVLVVSTTDTLLLK